MFKFVVASHGDLAHGYQSTLEMFLGTGYDITYISAYLPDGPDLEEQIDQVLETVTEETQLIIFTDLFGGSVNQKFIEHTKDMENVFIVAGVNLPTILEVMTIAMTGDTASQALIEEKLVNTRQEIKQYPLVEAKKEEKEADDKPAEPAPKKEEIVTGEVNDTIPALRVDERLVHGQIVMLWSKVLSLDGIIVANDEVAENEVQQSSLNMAVPDNIKIVIRTIDGAKKLLRDPRIKRMHVLVLTKTIADAVAVTDGFETVEFLNIGNVGKGSDEKKEKWLNTVYVTDSEKDAAKILAEKYPQANLQNVPGDAKHLLTEFIK